MSDVSFHFRGKNFAVMGASSGIGRQVATDLLEAGANVLALARRKELMDEVFAAYPDQIVTAKVDARDQDNLDDVLKNFVAAKGKFHGSAYVAGIGGDLSLRMFDEERARRIMDVNFFGAIKFLKRLTGAAYANRGSSHVWIASIAAHCGTQGVAFYGASKGAMISALRSLSIEISKKKHRLNSVSPGWIQTPMTEGFSDNTGLSETEMHAYDRYLLGNDGRPEDVSNAVLFLLSDGARWITGTDVVVDGGYLAN